ncbi:MAG: hypothetical protein CM15mV70_410 [Caudoviricetes sp.]|nr:MAG: hypothetical protein CM15mV70_410 [Caudoviricetes sp.]
MSLELSGTTPAIKGVAGSVSAPAITGDDADTGISFPAANTIKFSTGGVERMSITDSGVTGISPGITMADQYRLTSNLSLSSNTFTTITSNWERPDQSGWGGIGTGMSESSGIFTFPQTGIYKITYFPLFDTSGSTVSNAWSYINCTINNSSYITFALACVSMQSGQMNSTALETYFDVTDVSTHKVQFQHYANVACIVSGNSDANRTSASFVRLGDT